MKNLKLLFIAFLLLIVFSCAAYHDLEKGNQSDAIATSFLNSLSHSQILEDFKDATGAFILGNENSPEITFNESKMEGLSSFLSSMKEIIAKDDFKLVSMALNKVVIDPEMTFKTNISLNDYTSGLSPYGDVKTVRNGELELEVRPRVMLFDAFGPNSSVRIVGEYFLSGNVEILMEDDSSYKITLDNFSSLLLLDANVNLKQLLEAIIPTNPQTILESITIEETSRIYLPNGNEDIDITIEKASAEDESISQIDWDVVTSNLMGSFDTAPNFDFSSSQIIPYISAFNSPRLMTTLEKAILSGDHTNTQYGTFALSWPVDESQDQIVMDFTLTDYQYSTMINLEEMAFLFPELAEALKGAPNSFGPKKITGKGSLTFEGRKGDNGIFTSENFTMELSGTTTLLEDESANYSVVLEGKFPNAATINLLAETNPISASNLDNATYKSVTFKGKELDAKSAAWIVENFW